MSTSANSDSDSDLYIESLWIMGSPITRHIGETGERMTTRRGGTIGPFRLQTLLLALVGCVLFSSATSVSEASDGLPPSIGSEIPICLDDIIQSLTHPIPPVPPGPQPLPFFIGCEVPGCDIGASGSIDLHVDLQGDVVESAILDINRLPANTELQFTGPGQKSADHTTRFFIGKSTKRFLFAKRVPRISGFPLVKMDRQVSTKNLVDALSSMLPPVAKISLSFDRAVLEKMATEVKKAHAPNSRELSTVELTLTQTHGKTVIGHRKIRYKINSCPKPPPKPEGVVLASDQIRLVDSQTMGGGPFAEEAIVLANGRNPEQAIFEGAGAPGRWTGSAAFKSRTIFRMPQNMLEDDGGCKQQDWANQEERCTSEISVFSQGRGMKFVTEVPAWTSMLGDKANVEVKAANSTLKVPIHFYSAWEHSAGTQQIAAGWWTEANMVFANMQSGIEFDTPGFTSIPNPSFYDAGCGNREGSEGIYSHFQIDPAELPQTARVFFVERSKDATIDDTPIYANGWTCDTPVYGAHPDHAITHSYNDIFISTSMANSTTLAHELGHALSLLDLNQIGVDPTMPEDWATALGRCFPPLSEEDPGFLEPACRYLMWSGSPVRSLVTKGESFRANVNQYSAVHRHKIPGRPLEGSTPRYCMDSMSNKTCPAVILDAN